MEVVGLTASIITLVGALSLTGSTLNKLRGLRGTPSYILTAVNMVSDFEATMRYVQLHLDGLEDAATDDMKFEINTWIDRAEKWLDSFNRFLEDDIFRKQEGTKGYQNLKLKRRAKWKEFVGEGRLPFETLQQELLHIKMNLMLALVVTNALPVPKRFTSIQGISLVRADDVSTVPKETAINSNTTAEMEKLISTGTSYNHVDDNDAESFSSVEPSTAIAKRNSGELANVAQQSRTYVKIETKLLSRTCQRRCPCQCHIPLQGSTPKWLQGLIGTAFFNFAGMPLLNRRPCNFKKCGNKDPNSGSLRFQYFFPAWLLPVSIELTASWRSLGGIGGTWTLKIPRMISHNIAHDKLYWIMGEGGSVEDFQRTIDTYGLRVTDIFPTKHYNSFFSMALAHRRVDICSLLLDSGVDLHFQSLNGLTFAQEFWLERSIDLNFNDLRQRPDLQEARDSLDFSPAHDLTFGNQIEDLIRQIELDPTIVFLQDCYGFTLLHWATRYIHLEIIDVLLSAGADVNAVCKQGRSVLSWAVESDSVACCQKLLNADADVGILDHDGENALLRALHIIPPNEEIVDLLLNAGIDMFQTNNRGDTSHALAVGNGGSPGIIEKLLQHGVDIEVEDMYGETVVFDAVRDNNHPILEFLCNSIAILNRSNRFGETLIHIAAWRGDLETMRILQEAKIEGLPMDKKSVQEYWACFDERDETFFGERASIEDEEEAFEDLLDSIIASDPKPAKKKRNHIPGAFPAESDDEQSEDDESELESSEHESDDMDDEEEEEREEEKDYVNPEEDEDESEEDNGDPRQTTDEDHA